MLQILAWLAVLTVILFALGEAISPFRSRHWFKLVFLPGILLTIGIQGLTARFSVEARVKCAPLHEGEAAFFMQRSDLPPLVGASFVLVSHTLLFAVFFGLVAFFESVSSFDSKGILLPSFFSSQLSGTDHLSVTQLDAVLDSWYNKGTTFAPYVLLLYLVAPVFANLRLRSREYLAAGVVLAGLGAVVFFDFLGLGFSQMKPEGVELLFVFPPWWGTFSLYVLTAAVALVIAAIARFVRYLVTPSAGRRGKRRGAMKVKIQHADGAPERPAERMSSGKRAHTITYE